MTDRDITSDSSMSRGEFLEGRRMMAAIGIDRYRTWPALDNAVNDALGAIAVFRELGFESLPPLLNEAATAEAIRRLVTDDLATLGGVDSLVLFFAGHGHTQTRTLPSGPLETGYIVPSDGDRPEGRTASWLRLDTWLSDVARIPARHVLVILDACHSGIALGSLIKWRGSGSARLATPLDELRRRQSRRVITSALGDQRAMDGGPIRGHSLFTGCLIEGLTGGLARDGRNEVTGSEIGVYVQQRVTSYTGSRQTPDFGTLELDDRGELVVPLSGDTQLPRQPTHYVGTGQLSTASTREFGGQSQPVAPVAADARPSRPISNRPLDVTPAANHLRGAVHELHQGGIGRRDDRDVRGHSAVQGPPAVMPLKRAPKQNPLTVWGIRLAAVLLVSAPFSGITVHSPTRGVACIIASLLIAVVVAVGRMVSRAPAALQSFSAAILRHKVWVGTVLAAPLAGVPIGMSIRDNLDRECSQKLAAADELERANRAGASKAFADAAETCAAIDRDDDVRRATNAAGGIQGK